MKKNHCGFTLVELLVVIAVIGVLVTLALVSFGPAQKQARDVQRKSDLKQYQSALENFANKTSGFLYPSRTMAVEISTLCDDLGLSGSCPTDPKDPELAYNYLSDGTGGVVNDATKYVLWATLENTGDYWVVCANGMIGPEADEPVTADCPL